MSNFRNQRSTTIKVRTYENTTPGIANSLQSWEKANLKTEE